MKHLHEIERQIISRLILDVIGMGRFISVYDGEEISQENTNSAAKVKAVIGDTDETHIYVNDVNGVRLGWVFLVHGNLADVISDYTIGLEDFLVGANEVAEKFQ